MSILKTDTIWAGGFGFGISYNSGVTWHYPFVTGGTVGDIVRFDERTGWIVTAHLNDKRILFTEDGGITWIDFLIIDGPTLISISNVGYNYLWCVGDSGSILHYNRQINSSAKEENLESQDYSLIQNYPNPFNQSTLIPYVIKKPAQNVELKIYDLSGKQVKTLVSKEESAGSYKVRWDGTNEQNIVVSSGIYFYRMTAGTFTQIKRMLVLR